jgi:FixJ family two-component response regulator
VHPNKIIAFDLEISLRTVEIYRANVITNMKARSKLLPCLQIQIKTAA